MKSYIRFILLSLCLITPSLMATSSDVALELARANKMQNVIKRINSVYEYANSYILQTADSDITKDKIKDKFSLSDKSFEGYSGESFAIEYEDEKIVFTNAAPANPSEKVKKLIKNSSELHSRALYKDNKFYFIINQTGRNFLIDIENIKNIGKNTIKIAKDESSADKSKLWYKPDGKGSFEISSYDGTSWNTQVSNLQGSDDSVKVLKSKSNLDNLKLPIGTVVYVENNTTASAEAYVMSKDGWAKESVVSNNSLATSSECTAKTLGAIRISKEKGCTQYCASNGEEPEWKCFGNTKAEKCTTIYNSCYAIKQANPSSKDGTYTIDPDGKGGEEPFNAYCDMTTDGGGWTLVAIGKEGNGHNLFPLNNKSYGKLISPMQTSRPARLSLDTWGKLGNVTRWKDSNIVFYTKYKNEKAIHSNWSKNNEIPQCSFNRITWIKGRQYHIADCHPLNAHAVGIDAYNHINYYSMSATKDGTAWVSGGTSSSYKKCGDAKSGKIW